MFDTLITTHYQKHKITILISHTLFFILDTYTSKFRIKLKSICILLKNHLYKIFIPSLSVKKLEKTLLIKSSFLVRIDHSFKN